MTHHVLAVSAPAVPTAAAGGSPATQRLLGLDLARALAIFGMFAVHVGPDPSVGGPLGWVMELASGRSSAMFALLAGFTLVLMTGRSQPRTGREGRQAVGRVLIRSAVLIFLGYALTALDTPVNVILAFYGLLLVLALPLYRLRASTLAVIAASTALVLPQVLYLLRATVEDGSWAEAVIAHDPLARITGSDGVVELIVTGAYPVLTWLPFVVAGMAVARLGIDRPGVPAKLALSGGVLAVLGYGGSWLALRLVPGAQAAVNAATGGGSAASAWWSDAVGDYPTRGTPAWLLVAAPHSETTWSILGNTGVALLVLVACLTAIDRSPRFRRWAVPAIAVGSVSLTAYVGHIIAIKALGTDDMAASAALPVLLGFITVAMLLAFAWTRYFRRGPMEYLLYAATTPARLIN
ncbi:heparan-alpha-glucosaminide N-acetyltransferase domain-containing protein [Streptomyces sannanensis]|uniref:Heparan-alpha-glucosaminide N-acetyltransferase domain-containing protein n=1 Tax=Streptomyces sannanensis TaxID=285536 RepID=A0ABP6SK18_9ACTN